MLNTIPILLALIAGLSTGIGSLIAILVKKISMKTLSFALGVSAGVMLYVSFIELIPNGIRDIGTLQTTIYFFAGTLFIVILDYIVPEEKNPHHIADIVGSESENAALKASEVKQIETKRSVKRMGMLTALIIFLHNIPEGLITFMTASHDISLGILITFAVAIHNIPEGISVAMPILYATNNRKKAFGYSFLSGLAELVAALLAALILAPLLTTYVIGILVVFTAGIMVYISLDEILPTAQKYCTDEDGHKGNTVGLGVITGMLIMALSLLLLTPGALIIT